MQTEQKIYVPDFNKIQTLDQLKAIIIAIGFAFDEQHPFFEQLQPLLLEITPENRAGLVDEQKKVFEELGLTPAPKNDGYIQLLD